MAEVGDGTVRVIDGPGDGPGDEVVAAVPVSAESERVVAAADGWRDKLRGIIAPPPGEAKSLLAVATGVMSIAAVYLYFTGYMFALFYYKGFGLTLESLDVSTQYFFVSSYTVFQTVPGMIVFGVMALIVFGYAAGVLRQWLLVVCLVAMFPVLFHISYSVARRDVADERSHPEAFVKFRFKAEDAAKVPVSPAVNPSLISPPKETMTSEKLTELGDNEQLDLLLETKDRIIVFYQPVSSFLPTGATPPVQVYTLLRSDLKWSVVTTQ